jgi:hypothetical protein
VCPACPAFARRARRFARRLFAGKQFAFASTPLRIVAPDAGKQFAFASTPIRIGLVLGLVVKPVAPEVG